MSSEQLITLDFSTFLVILLGIVNLLVIGPTAWILKSAMRDLRELEISHDGLKEALPKEYVRRDEYIRDIDEMKGMLRRIFEKLDHKEDKH